MKKPVRKRRTKSLAGTKKPAPRAGAKKTEIIAKVTSEGKRILLFTGGVALGALAVKGINYVLKVDDTTTGFKKAIAPMAVTLGGFAGAMFLPKDEFKIIAAGAATSGVLKGVKVFAGKDLLAGLNGLGAGEEMRFEIKEFKPNLPELEGFETDTIDGALRRKNQKLQLLDDVANKTDLEGLEEVVLVGTNGMGDTFDSNEIV